jgi:hypothetical protein
MAARKKSSGRKYGKAASKRVESAMKRRKKGTLKSGKGGKGGKVKSRKQAIAIGLSEARAKGAKVPRKKSAKKGARKKTTGRKKTTRKKSTRKKSS